MDIFEPIIGTLPKADANNLPLSNLLLEEELAQLFFDCCNDLPGAVTVRCSYKTYQKMVRVDRKNSQRRKKDAILIGSAILDGAKLPESLLVPSCDSPHMQLSNTALEFATEDPLHVDRRTRLFGGLQYLDLPGTTKSSRRIRSLRFEINPPMNHQRVKKALYDLFHHEGSLLAMPVLERFKVSVAPFHEIENLSAALSSSLHVLNEKAPSLRTLCLERTPMDLLMHILSPFSFYGPFPNSMGKRLTRIHVKNAFEALDISAFALAESLEDLSFSGMMTYDPEVPAQARIRDRPLPDADPIPEEMLNDMWRTLYPNHHISPGFTPPNNVDFVCIPNLRRLCVGTISMPTLRRLQLPMLKKLTILHMGDEDITLPEHSLVLGDLKELDIGTYCHEVDAIVAPKLKEFKLGIPENTNGIIELESDWCTRGCNTREDGTFIHNCDGTNRGSHANILKPPLLNCVFDGDEAMLQPRVLHISGPVHDYVLVDALRNLPELSSLTLNYRVEIGDKFWRFMTPQVDLQPTDSTRPASTQRAQALLCPKLKSLTLDLCTKSPNTAESNSLRKRICEMIEARNHYAGIAPLKQVIVQWEAPAESWNLSAMGSPNER
jgi:hypothetical protein